MNGWFDMARISCSASARLILFRLIISFLLSTFIANSLSVFFSRTRYTLPTSPFPSSLIFSNELGVTSTVLVLIELDEYVRRKPTEGGCSELPAADRLATTLVEWAREPRVPVTDNPDGFRKDGVLDRTGVEGEAREDPDVLPLIGCGGGVVLRSTEGTGVEPRSFAFVGKGGGVSGAFFANSAFALGADTTRRMKR